MKKISAFIILLCWFTIAGAHEGEDHGEKKPAVAAATGYFSSEALSDKYEVLVKYGELQANAESRIRLFLSHAVTNRAIDSATITVKVLNNPGVQLQVARIDTGIYELKGTFPANGIYDLQVNINSPLGPDFLQVGRVEIGRKLNPANTEVQVHWYTHPFFWAVMGLLLGLLLMYLLMRKRNRKVVVTTMILLLLIPTAAINPSAGHGGEDHGDGSSAKSGGLSNVFRVEKESQFLFDILTSRLGSGEFYQATEMTGTVIAAPQGMAVIQTPQAGKIVSLRVAPGQQVSKGQTLAVIEQQVDAGTQLDIIAERNRLNAEVKAAKAQYDRLLAIADIAAKKDVTEAKARYETAVQNLRLFNANVGRNMGNTKMITLAAPISGVVGTFNYAIGAVVNAGETIFELTNLNRLYVETQVFAPTPAEPKNASYYTALSNYDTVQYKLRMVSTAQAVNTESQSQKVVFEILDPEGRFKIGENIRVLKFGSRRMTDLVVPTSSIIDIGGKPALFVKDSAEKFTLSFIRKGQSNPFYTSVLQGAEAGERIVTANVYQMKMIYLGQ
ncbi:MAG TPA: efflux RND transporter periplasmic adaptor subunit [Chitinophagaceae bacterium]